MYTITFLLSLVFGGVRLQHHVIEIETPRGGISRAIMEDNHTPSEAETAAEVHY